MTVYDVLGLCKFSRSLFWLEEDVVDAIEAVTGIRFTIEQLMAIGERIYNLQRLFNIREGFTRKDDYLPYRVTHEPISNGVTKGVTFLKKNFRTCWISITWQRLV